MSFSRKFGDTYGKKLMGTATNTEIDAAKTASKLVAQKTAEATEGFFFLSGFSSQTLTIHRTAGEGTGPSFIPLYHLHSLTNIEKFICNFACEMTITYF